MKRSNEIEEEIEKIIDKIIKLERRAQSLSKEYNEAKDYELKRDGLAPEFLEEGYRLREYHNYVGNITMKEATNLYRDIDHSCYVNSRTIQYLKKRNSNIPILIEKLLRSLYLMIFPLQSKEEK